LLFVYPVVGQNEFELVDHPISQRILMAVAKELGCCVEWEVARISEEEFDFYPQESSAAEYVILHPMISSLDRIADLVSQYRKRMCKAEIVVQTSDQNQHEKLIGGPRGAEIAEKLLEEIAEIDTVLLGFAEYPLIMNLLGKRTTTTFRREGRGNYPGFLFRFDSLPDAAIINDSDSQQVALRVQRSRGCLSPCTYCIEGQANRSVDGERPWEGIPIEEFVGRLAKYEQRGFFFVNINDSSFEDPGKRGLRDLHRFCDLLIQRNIRLSYKIHLRAENAPKVNSNDLARWKQAGIDVIVCGLESGSQVELDLYRKIATKKVSGDAFRHLEETDQFCTILGYMMFSPISKFQIWWVWMHP
jgi:radical SAM superfamily enzyme YgiQ (UPF0313 family)